MNRNKGFTLIELLIVIAIIAILASAVFIVLDPLTRFADARDATRASDSTQILTAIKKYQIDNRGYHIDAIVDMATDTPYLIVGGAKDASCDTTTVTGGLGCNFVSGVASTTACVDLSGLATAGYLPKVPISPDGNVEWDNGDADGDNGTGYILEKSSNGVIRVRSCEAENTTEKIEFGL